MMVSRRVLLTGVALALAGCSRVIGPVGRQFYTLNPTLPPADALPSVTWQLAVALPDAPEALDTERIALSRSSTTMDYYAEAVWTDRVPALIQALTVRAFESSGKIVAVARDTAGLKADYELETEIHEFDSVYPPGGGTPDVVVSLQARLVKLPDRAIIGHLNADQRATASRNDLDGVVSAFNQALGASLGQIVAWTLRTPKPT